MVPAKTLVYGASGSLLATLFLAALGWMLYDTFGVGHPYERESIRRICSQLRLGD